MKFTEKFKRSSHSDQNPAANLLSRVSIPPGWGIHSNKSTPQTRIEPAKSSAKSTPRSSPGRDFDNADPPTVYLNESIIPFVIPPETAAETDELPAKTKSQFDTSRFSMVKVTQIIPNPHQPRKYFDQNNITSLAESIKRHGLLQPVTIRRINGHRSDSQSAETINDAAKYELIAGERRLRAAKIAGMIEIPCILTDMDERCSAELAIIENIQRENLNMFEQAEAISTLISAYSLTQEQIARSLSLSQSYVANKLRLLRIPKQQRHTLIERKLTERHARELLRIDDDELRAQVIDEISKRGLNVSATEDYINRLLAEREAEESEKKRARIHKIIIKDMRLFYNSIDHAVGLMKRAGIEVQTKKIEHENDIELSIRIPKPVIVCNK